MDASGDLVVVAVVMVAWVLLEIDARRPAPRHPLATSFAVPSGMSVVAIQSAWCLGCKRERPLADLVEFECFNVGGYLCKGGCPRERA